MNAEQIKRFFDNYQATLAEVERLDLLVRTQHDWDAWKQALTDRADYLHREYSRMKDDIAQMLSVFKADTPDLDEEAWTQFRMSLRDCYISDSHDLAIVRESAKILLRHIENQDSGNMEGFVQANLYLGYTALEYSRILREQFGPESVVYYQKAADLWPRYHEFDSHIIHQAIAVSMVNLTITAACLGTFPIEDAYRYWGFMKELRASGELEPDIAHLLDVYIRRFETDGFAIAITPKKPFDPQLREILIDMAEHAYGDEIRPQNWTADMFQVLFSQLSCAYERKQKTPAQCWKIVHVFYMQTHEGMNQEEIDVISYYATSLDALIQYLDEADMPRAEKQVYFRSYQDEIHDFITHYSKRNADVFTLNSALEELAFTPAVYHFFDTREEKIDFIIRMVVVRHCTTFLHSQMVSAFAQAILSAAIADVPELFIGYHGLRTAEDVQAHRAELLQFVDEAALLHDVGKNAMLTIIETQYRPLSDDEFSIIRNHPAKGAEYLSIDPDLARFKDITNGHHKFYNGKGGYPADFDNTASPERITIDLITLCDCLDAATDCYGRNYHHAKTVEQVLAEFERDSGVRYNPDFVRFLCGSPALIAQLQTIAGERRLEIYYQTYQKYFM